MEKVASQLRKSGDFAGVTCAYLEIASPSIAEAVDFWVRKKPAEIRVLPYFVLGGRHVKSHIPEIIAAARKKHGRGSKIILCPYLGYDERLVALARERILKKK